MDIKFVAKVDMLAGIKYDEEAKVFVTYTPTFNLFSQGTTEERAKAALRDAVTSFLTVAHRKGILIACLEEQGISVEPVCEAPTHNDSQDISALRERKYDTFFDASTPVPMAFAGG